ncbi:MAG: hypothetical protein ACHQXK_06640 [Methanosarcina thermophila]|uniref:hypothetical protein n=1 Tax=Methanosarcina flavescens TaxID=1715806 RepID=UPI001435498D|nr:hypothetical protein [Methanosarcina flavescens]
MKTRNFGSNLIDKETKITAGRFATSPAIYGDRIVWMGNPYDIIVMISECTNSH